MSRGKKALIAAGAVLVALVAVVSHGSEKLLDGPLTLSAAFSGLLALTGFMFTARTFITFKLNETVYGTDNYRQYVEELKRDGAHSDPLYAPLKELDSVLGRTCVNCLFSLFCLAMFAMIPKEWGAGRSIIDKLLGPPATGLADPVTPVFVLYQVLLWLVYAAMLVAILRVLWCISRVNVNIKSIISHWEDTYSKKSSKGGQV